jgi:Conserved TM helix
MPAEIQQLIDGIVQQTGPYLPRIGAALVILIIGFLVGVLLSWLVRAVVRATGLGGLIGRWLRRGEAAPPPPVDRWAGTAVFFIILLMTVIAAIEVLNITIITAPLLAMLTGIFGYLPQLIGAAILLLLAWLLATVLRFVVREVLDAFNINERVSGQVRDEDSAQAAIPLSQILGDVVFWLVFLLFLPAILGALGLVGLLAPVEGLVGEILAFLPNIIAAGLILVIGWFVAGIVRRLVTNLLVAAGADRLSERMGLAGAQCMLHCILRLIAAWPMCKGEVHHGSLLDTGFL